MTSYDLGDGVPLEHEVRDQDHALTDATTVLALTRPDGTTFTPTPTVTHVSTGLYRATPIPDAVGLWAGVWSTSGAVTSVKAFAFTVGNPAPAEYTTLSLVKSSLGKITADIRDDLIEQAITAASRQIDRRTGRRFYADRAASARTFSIGGRYYYDGSDQLLIVDDIASVADLAVSTGSVGAWSTVSAWEGAPDNALAYGRPLTRIRVPGSWLPSTGRVQVTARWGWPAVPDEIAQATQLQAARLYRRKDSPEGVLGSSEWGAVRVSRIDPDVEALIAPFVIPPIA